MNGTLDIDQTVSDGDGAFDPRRAATLLSKTEAQVKHQLDADLPLLSVFGAGLMLVAYGALWLSARGEQTYTGPRGPWLVLGLLVIVGSFAARGQVIARTRSGVAGATRRREAATNAAPIGGIASVYVLDAALSHAGASKSIVFGVFDAAGPVIVLAAAAAAAAAGREDWPGLGVGLAMMLVAAGAAFAGPAAVWGLIGIGGCVVLLAHAGAKVYLERR